MHKQVQFTRESLHRLVWERPVSALAKEIGVSDVAVAKACRKAGIPLPSRGHWAIIKTGRVIKTLTLPALTAGQAETVSFTLSEDPPAKSRKLDLPAGPRIEVPTELNKPHHLVAELRASAKAAREDKGVLPLNYQKVLRVRTSAIQLKRALILLDTLIKQLEKRGYKVRLSETRPETELVLNEGVVSFRLDERTKRTAPPPPPPRPPGRRGESYRPPWQPAYLLVGTGEFTLEFGKYALRGCRNTWKDRVKCSVEAQLSEIIATIPTWEAALLASRLEREDRQAREREAEKQRIAIAREQEVLRLQRTKLVREVRAWERADRLRRFIAAFEQIGVISQEALTWLKWANLQVELLDPLSDAKAVTWRDVELSQHFTGRSSWEKPVRDWWT